MKYWVLLFITILFANLAEGQDTGYRTVTAQKGDGIYRLLSKNGLSYKTHSKEFIELNKENLGPDNSLYIGRIYKLPNNEELLTIPILGKEHEKLVVKDKVLENTVFYLVSGHGGPDPGAMGKVGAHILCEDEYAYDVTLRLGRALLERGAKVYFIIRDPEDGIRNERYLKNSKNEVCYLNHEIPLDVNARLRQRVETINRLNKKEPSSKYKRCIAIHVDARKKHKNIDIFFYHNSRSKSGQKLAENMRNVIEQKYLIYQPNRGYNGSVSTRRLYMITHTDPIAVYVELGNINHQRDQQRLLLEDNRQALANWMCEGIIEDYKNR